MTNNLSNHLSPLPYFLVSIDELNIDRVFFSDHSLMFRIFSIVHTITYNHNYDCIYHSCSEFWQNIVLVVEGVDLEKVAKFNFSLKSTAFLK